MAAFRFVTLACAVVLTVWALLIPDTISRMMRDKEALSEIENIWKKHWLGQSLLTVGALCVVVGWWLPIPSGYAITGIAVIAGIMALRPDMGGWERSLWFVVLLLFAVMEIRAINRDRKDQTDKFTKTSEGLQTSIVNSKMAVERLEATIKENRSHFDVTMRGISKVLGVTDESLKQITGGGQFCYLSIGLPNHLPNGKFVFQLAILNSGPLPLDVCHVSIHDDSPITSFKDAERNMRSIYDKQLGPLAPGREGKEKGLRGLLTDFIAQEGSYYIQIATRNKRFYETLTLRPVTPGKGMESIEVRDEEGKVVYSEP